MLEPLMVRLALPIELSRLRFLFSVYQHNGNFCRLHRYFTCIPTLHSVLALPVWRQSVAPSACAVVGGALCAVLPLTQSSPLGLPLLIYKQSIIIDSAALSCRSYHGWTNQTSTAGDLVLACTINTANKRAAKEARARLHPASAYFRSVERHARIGIQVPHSYLRRPGQSHVQVCALHSSTDR